MVGLLHPAKYCPPWAVSVRASLALTPRCSFTCAGLWLMPFGIDRLFYAVRCSGHRLHLLSVIFNPFSPKTPASWKRLPSAVEIFCARLDGWRGGYGASWRTMARDGAWSPGTPTPRSTQHSTPYTAQMQHRRETGPALLVLPCVPGAARSPGSPPPRAVPCGGFFISPRRFLWRSSGQVAGVQLDGG